ncbi:MAG: caspase family protein [Pseudomonadota bacterium]
MTFSHSDRIVKLRTALLIALFAALFLPVKAAAEGRWALVLAVSEYREIGILDLPNAANDGRTMASVLNQMGFEVYYAEDASKEEFDAMVAQIKVEQQGSDLGMFFFAGHGVQLEGVNYALPSTISRADGGNLESAAISVNNAIRELGETQVENLVVILDACREPPFSNVEASGTGLALVDAPQNTIIAYSTAPGELASDGEGANSPYTAALATALEGGETDLRDVLRLVRAQVRLATGGTQTPWFIDNSRGEMIIAPRSLEGAAEELPLLQEGEISLAATAWWTIANSADPRDFQTYLELFPASEQAAVAQRQLAIVDDLPDFPLMDLGLPETNPVIPGGLSSLITACDVLASGGRGYMSLVESVPHNLINLRAATRACVEAVQNDPENPRLLGLLSGVLFLDERYPEALHYVTMAIDRGHAGANGLLAQMYRFGLGVEQDMERSAEAVLAGILGGADGMRVTMGVYYREGRGVPQSFDEARRWFELSVHAGHVSGMSALGDMYRRGQLGEPDPERALSYYRMAAALHQSDAVNNVGMAYMRGDGVEQDTDVGLSFLSQASDLGNPYAAYHLGRAFLTGWGVEENPNQAIAYFRLSAQRNFLGAYISIGDAYLAADPPQPSNALANYIIAREAGLLKDTSRSREEAQEAQARIDDLAANMTDAERSAGEVQAQEWIDQYGLLDFTRLGQ